jgi:hypothetical protein
LAPSVSELGVGGGAGDGEVALVVGGVVGAAQGDEVLLVGGAAVFPVPDVVDVQAAGASAAGDAAAPIAVDDQASELGWDDVGGASDVQR